jgi:MOSC domain-containing protein YiiM
MPRVLALYAGSGGTLATSTGVVPTAIAKSAVRGRVRVERDGLPGELAAGDAIEPVERAAHGITVADAVTARFGAAPSRELVAAVLAVPALAAEWRLKTAPRLAAAA